MIIRPCEICGKQASDRHHKFANYKWRRKLYGKRNMDNPINIQYLCNNCHISKSHGIIVWNEQEFCEALEIEKRGK